MISPVPLLENAYARLRLVQEADAAFILELRMDESRNRWLSAVDGDVEKQAAWIRAYKEREKAGTEYYFVIESLSGEGLGAVRVYDLREDSFCWGSWIIKPGSPAQTAISSAILVYAFGFDELGFPRCHFEVQKGNQKVIDFHVRMGARQIDEDENQFFYNYEKADYEKLRTKYAKYLRRES